MGRPGPWQLGLRSASVNMWRLEGKRRNSAFILLFWGARGVPEALGPLWGSLWERHSAVTTPSQAQVAGTFLSHTETVKEPQPKMNRSVKTECQTPKIPGARAGQLVICSPPFPVRGRALSSSQCLPHGDVGSAFHVILAF